VEEVAFFVHGDAVRERATDIDTEVVRHPTPPIGMVIVARAETGVHGAGHEDRLAGVVGGDKRSAGWASPRDD
jgi:hypothetical protein